MQFKLVIPKTIHQQKNLFDFGFYDTNSIVNIVITLPYFVGFIVIKKEDVPCHQKSREFLSWWRQKKMKSLNVEGK